MRLPNSLVLIRQRLGPAPGSGDAAPTAQNEAMFAELKSEAIPALARWRELKTGEVAAFEKLSM